MHYVLRANLGGDRYKYIREDCMFVRKFLKMSEALKFLKHSTSEYDTELKWECITSYEFERSLKRNPVAF